MSDRIILASKSKIRKDILDNYKILNEVKPSNVDEDIIKDALIKEKASPEIISKNLAELKANKVSSNQPGQLVLGADSVIDLENELSEKIGLKTSIHFNEEGSSGSLTLYYSDLDQLDVLMKRLKK